MKLFINPCQVEYFKILHSSPIFVLFQLACIFNQEWQSSVHRQKPANRDLQCFQKTIKERCDYVTDQILNIENPRLSEITERIILE